MLDREKILDKAYHDCMYEMYAKAQPEADWDNMVEEYRAGKIGKDERVYERHYLSMDEFLYIRNKYKSAYGIKSHWKDDVEVVEDYLKNGGNKDKYIKDYDDEYGHHPGYRSYEKVPPIVEQIGDCLTKYTLSSITEEIANEITNIVLENIKNCKDFYRFDREEESFDCNIALGTSPTSNPETVKKWWKENYNQDIEIEEHNPRLFWYRDMGYTDEDLVEEFESENWKEIVDKEWEEEKAEKKRKEEEALKSLEEEYAKFKNNSHEDPICEQGDDDKEVISNI